MLRYLFQGCFRGLCGGDEDGVDSSLLGGCDERLAFADRDVGKQDGVYAGVGEFLIELGDPAGEGNVAVDEHADGKFGEFFADLSDQFQRAIDGGSVVEGTEVGALDCGAVCYRVGEGDAEFEGVGTRGNGGTDDC
ncbi:hypothetical protein AOT42_03695 [Corynebacterium diphtheriae bv. gravis]|uniref:Uncharacterized protein n=1 Tax=Corynebacterium diphtheriae bv. gravis TaxID=1720349 RepID=A0AAX0J0S0_CORDP|nr:hypothetical protein AOT42_03695 [Corynebacterium diphtheriae bv. gravis]